MFKNYLKTTIRLIFRNKSQSIINILGLSLGLAAFILIWMFVFTEFSYDEYHENSHRIKRVGFEVGMGVSDSQPIPATPMHAGPGALEIIPEVEAYTRLVPSFGFNANIRYQDKILNTGDFMYVDSTFFDVFTYKFIYGEPYRSLTEPQTMVLTRSLAEKIFDSAHEAYNQLIYFNDESFRITGIIEDVPENSHFGFSVLLSLETIWGGDNEPSTGFNCYTYLLLHENYNNNNDFESKFNEAITDYLYSTHSYYDPDLIQFEAFLQPLEKIHLHSNMIWELGNNGNYTVVILFIAISVFIILLAIVNFVNLSTARAGSRAREIGVRKAMGSDKKKLITQFLTETFFITLISLIIALVIAEIFARPFGMLMERELSLAIILSPAGIAMMLIILLITGFLSGLYPAFYLSGFQPGPILKGEQVKGKGGKFFRKVLVTMQFIISMFLISVLFVVFSQLNYVSQKDLGFNRDNVLMVRDVSSQISANYGSLRHELLSVPGVIEVSGSLQDFTASTHMDQVRKSREDYKDGVVCNIYAVDHSFPELMEFSIKKGRFFSKDHALDSERAFIINETAVRALGLEEPIGKQLYSFGFYGEVVGVVNDFNFRSLHSSIEPLLFLIDDENYNYLYIRLSPENQRSTVEQIKSVLSGVDPHYVHDIIFMENRMEQYYQGEQRTGNLVFYGSILAIFISMMGVYSLAAFTAEQRTKELGIRKVLGASHGMLLWLFNKENLLLVIIAFVITIPLSWWVADYWLSNFEYQISLNPLIFILPGIIAFVLCFITASLQAWRVIRSNPAESLRTE